MLSQELIEISDRIELVQTCGACPEQYDAFLDWKQVWYLRLRHWFFSVSYPDVSWEDIYQAQTKWDWIFESDEREFYLRNAKLHIANQVLEATLNKFKDNERI